MIGKTLTSVLLLSLTACANTENQSISNITFSPLKSAYASYSSEISKTRPSLVFDGGTSASNCTEYFSVRKAANILETDANFLVAQEYLICDSLSAIKNATPINESSVSNNVIFNAGVPLASKVDLRAFRSSFKRRADAQMHTLDTMPRADVTTEQYAAIIDNKDWLYVLRVVARLDLNNNGKEDWLTDKAKMGSYSTLSGFVACDVNNKQIINLDPLIS
ncbi:MAG: hypothetical protein ACJAUP_000072 [Cellvibrionaceae bacterium]|jgi:hypothetical protein